LARQLYVTQIQLSSEFTIRPSACASLATGKTFMKILRNPRNDSFGADVCEKASTGGISNIKAAAKIIRFTDNFSNKCRITNLMIAQRASAELFINTGAIDNNAIFAPYQM
jgi:hypothetical protein